MRLVEILQYKNMTAYRLSQLSGVPQTTIADICNGKSKISKCSVGTVYNISKVLNISIESLLELDDYSSFDVYKSTVCHSVKNNGDLQFIVKTLKSDRIRCLYNERKYPEALYLLAMIDYLSRENDIPLCNNYNDIRKCRLKEPVYPNSVLALRLVDSEALEKAKNNAIPEFIRFNIVEAEVRNIV